ncbi:Uncharacterised protein [Bordetella pertussis]|nr:Uncharacterised protein [Bordetella pertussis]
MRSSYSERSGVSSESRCTCRPRRANPFAQRMVWMLRAGPSKATLAGVRCAKSGDWREGTLLSKINHRTIVGARDRAHPGDSRMAGKPRRWCAKARHCRGAPLSASQINTISNERRVLPVE